MQKSTIEWNDFAAAKTVDNKSIHNKYKLLESVTINGVWPKLIETLRKNVIIAN